MINKLISIIAKIISILGLTLLLRTIVIRSCNCSSNKAQTIFESIEPDFLGEVKNILSKKFDTEIQIKSIVKISQPESRNLVLRIFLHSSTKDIPVSVIFKQALLQKSDTNDKEAYARFARDWAGLEFLNEKQPDQSLASRFYGGNKYLRFILLEDFGENQISLVDSLTGKNKLEAEAALQRFMVSLGKFHGTGYGNTNHYLKILARINPDAESVQDKTKRILKEISKNVNAALNLLNLQFTAAIQKEIDTVIKSVFERGDFTTYIHADICPDNTFDYPESNILRIIDFEHGYIGSALLDATYLRMCMPTCWCAGKIPDELIDSVEFSYRNELMKKIPAARDNNKFIHAYVNACAFWMLENVGAYVAGEVPKEARALARIQAFIDIAEKYDKLPDLRSMAQNVVKELKIRWKGVKSLNLFPAFNSLTTILISRFDSKTLYDRIEE